MKAFFNRLLGNTYTIKRAAALLAVTALLSNVLGFLRNAIFYRTVSGPQLDIYFASFRLPDFIFNVLILGAISSAFIPLLSGIVAKEREEKAWEVSNQVLSCLTVVFAIVGIVMYVSMPLLMKAVVPGFDPARFAQSITISRILLLQSIFFAWSWTFGGILNSFQRFASYAVAPLLYNVSIIVGGFLAKSYGIKAIAWSVVIGALFHMAIQYVEVRKIGYKPKFNLKISAEVKEVLKLMVPRSISLGMAQLVLIVFTMLGSGLMKSSIAVFSGLNDLQTTPTVIVANSLAVAFFPTLTQFAAKEEWENLSILLMKVLRSCLFLLLPMITLGYLVRFQIITLYFSRDVSTSSLTALAISTFAWFLVGIIPTAIVTLLARVFYSLKDTKTPLILNIVGAIAGILTAVVGIYGFHGQVPVLGMANSVEDVVQVILYLYLLYKLQPMLLSVKRLGAQTVAYIGGCIIMIILGWVTLHILVMAHTNLVIQLLGTSIIATLAYYLYSRVMHNEELGWLQSNLSMRRR